MIKSYLITDPLYYQPTSKSFASYLSKVYQHHRVDYACFRDKKNINIQELAKIFLNISNKQKTLINGNVDLAVKLGFFGVHLTSKQFDKISSAKAQNLFVIISTHSKKEALYAEKLGADAVTFSPIFKTPNKANPKGVQELKEVVPTLKIKTFALGGILNDEQIQQCEKANVYGFASIRYFTK